MKILFLSHYFPPEVNAPATRTLEHCRQWVANGHDVTVITCAPNHPHGKVYPGFRNRLVHREEVDGIRVIRVWTFISANRFIFRRTTNYVSFMLSAVVASIFVQRPDVVITTSPQFFNGLAGIVVKALRNIPWVLEIRDLWPDSIFELGALQARPVKRALYALEAFAYRFCDRLVVVTDAFKQRIQDKGVDSGKISVIKNGVDLNFFDAQTQASAVEVHQHAFDGKFVVAYFGTHGLAHKLESVLAAANRLRDRTDIIFLLVGDGAERPKLVKMRDRMGLSNVVMLDQRPKAEMPALWRLAGVSVIPLKKTDVFTTVIPSKIFESMAMRRPILLAVDGEARALVERAQAGVFVDPENDALLAQQIVSLADDPRRCAALGEAGRRYVEQHFDRTDLARRFEMLLESLAHQESLAQLSR